MKVLVTGASGFLGVPLVARLRADGMAVRALVRPGKEAGIQADEVATGDLRDEPSLARAVSGVDAVVHCGARVSTSGSWEEFEAVNVLATRRLIALAADAGVGRFVHVSSLSVYGIPYDGAVVTEDGPFEEGVEERGGYARSKFLADQLAREAIATGARVTIVRPGLLYGPGRKPPLARRAVGLGPLRVIVASPDYLLPLAYVENVADALSLAVRVPAAAGRAYTVVDTHAPQSDYARLYRRVGGGRWVALHAPLRLVGLAVGALESLARVLGRRSPITRHQVERTLRSARFDVTRAERELGWRPRVPLEEALRRSFAGRPAGEGAGAAQPMKSAA